MMPSQSVDDTSDTILDDALTLTVTFKFEEQWHIGRVGEADASISGEETTPVDRPGFPAGKSGGGLTGTPISGDGTTPVDRPGFPAGKSGGGLTPRPRPGIVIAPVHLKTLAPANVAAIIRHRAEDMAMLAEAITIANIQFREALDDIADAGTAPQDDPS